MTQSLASGFIYVHLILSEAFALTLSYAQMKMLK